LISAAGPVNAAIPSRMTNVKRVRGRAGRAAGGLAKAAARC